MKRIKAWHHRYAEHKTPRSVGILIAAILIADTVLCLLLGKTLLFPFSKTGPQYLLWLLNSISVGTGYVFWSIFIAFSVLGPLVTGKRPRATEFTSFIESLLKAIAEALTRLPVVASMLVVATLVLVGLATGLSMASRPPAAPRAGQLVIPTDPRSLTFYQATDNVVAIFNRADIGPSMVPVQALRVSDALRFQSIAVTFDQNRIFATDPELGLVHVINGERLLHEEGHIHVGKTAGSLALSADGRKLYVAVVGPIPLGTIRVFDTASLEEIASIGGFGCPMDLFTATETSWLFVITQCGAGNDPLYVIDTRKDEVIKKLRGFAVGHSVVATREGRTAFVSTGDSLSIVRDWLGASPDIKKQQLSVTTMTLSQDEQTLFVGIRTAGQGAILSLDPGTGETCGPEPVALEAAPLSIVIAPDGLLFAPLPKRFFTGDAHALGCDS